MGTVVGIVVTCGQRVGAEDDAALHLVAKTCGAGGGHDSLDSDGAVFRYDAQAVAHAVVACQVGGHLGGHDHVVGADGLGDGGQGDLNDLCACGT